VDTNLGDIHAGMEVFGLDGKQIGTVGHVWLTPRDAMSPGETPPAEFSPSPVAHSFFEVQRSDAPLYVPFGAVTVLFPGENVTLDCTEHECLHLYRRKLSEV
jgi:hypothetical protein